MAPIVIIFLTVFLDMVGIGILTPVVPFLIRQFSADAVTVGLTATIYSIAQFVASPVLGALSDRYGRRPVLVISLLGSAFGYVLFGWATTLAIALLSRAIDGVTGGNISTAQAYLADISRPEDRAKNFGLIGAAFGLGFILGPAIGGLLAKVSLTAPAYAAGALSLVTCLAAWFFLPESLPAEKRTAGKFAWRELDPIRQMAGALRRPPLRALLLAVFAINFAMAGLQTNFGVFAFDRFAMGPAAVAVVFAAIGTAGAITQGLLIRKIAPLVDGRKLALFGISVATLGFAAIPLSPSIAWLYPSCMLIALGMGFSGPSLMGLLSGNVSVQEQGSIIGVTQSVASLTRVLGPLWAGALYDSIGQNSPYWSGVGWMLAGIALAAAVAPAKAPSS